MEDQMETRPSLVQAIDRMREALQMRTRYLAPADSSDSPVSAESAEPPSHDLPPLPQNSHPAQLAMTMTTNEWVQLENGDDGPRLWFTTEGIVFDSRHTRIHGACSRLTFAAYTEDLFGQADTEGEAPSFDGNNARPETDQCIQSYSFSGGDTLLMTGPSVAKLKRLNTGGGVLSAVIAAAVVAGTGEYEDCTGTATFSLTANLKPWHDDAELLALLSGFEASVIAEFSIVLREGLSREKAPDSV